MKRKGRPSCIYTGVVGQERKSVWSFCGVLFLGGSKDGTLNFFHGCLRREK